MRSIFVAVFFALVLAGNAHADPATELLGRLEKQLLVQQKMIEAQQKQLDEQKELLEKLGARLDHTVAGNNAPAKAERPVAETPPPEAPSTVDDVALAEDEEMGTTASEAATRVGANTRDEPGHLVHIARGGPFSLEVGGLFHTLGIYSAKRTLPTATVFFLTPEDQTGVEDTFNMSAQYSRAIASVRGPRLGGFDTGAEFQALFSGGSITSDDYGITPGLAYVWANSGEWYGAAGLNLDMFSPRVPTMVDGISALAASGNPGNMQRAQARLERSFTTGETGQLTIGAAIAEPFSTIVNDLTGQDTNYEDNGIPNIESVVKWNSGPAEASALLPWPGLALELSGVYGQFRSYAGRQDPVVSNVWGVAAGAGIRIGNRFGIQGEAYAGEALGNYLGCIQQISVQPNPLLLSSLEPISCYGGWGELAYAWSPDVVSHLGYGIDHVSSDDLTLGYIQNNQTAYANVMWSVTPYWQLSVEGTWRATDWVGFDDNAGPAVMVASAVRF